jgi:hypothetical protein
MEHITMSRKEREQLIVFEQIKTGVVTRVEAAARLSFSDRWIRKKYKRYVSDGATGLVHRNRTRVSHKRWNEDDKTCALELLSGEWHGFGPTFASEKLEELKGIKVSKETLRNAMISAGLWQAKRKRIKHRKRRERRAMFGMMVQLDGSPHDWFEGRGPECRLLVFIDDATSKLLWLEFVTSESNLEVIRSTKRYIQHYGRPHEFYVDHGSVFHVNLNNDEHDKITQWERIIDELSIKVNHAHSPQAKGRVERANKTLQDRLIKEMRLAGVSSMEQANKFVSDSHFIDKHNDKFARPAAITGDAHRSTQTYNLGDYFYLKAQRVLTNDYTITFNKRIFQLGRQQQTIIRPKNTIVVRTQLDGSITLYIRNTKLNFQELYAKPVKIVEPRSIRLPIPRKVHENSRLWASGLPCVESRMKTASPAAEVLKRN